MPHPSHRYIKLPLTYQSPGACDPDRHKAHGRWSRSCSAPPARNKKLEYAQHKVLSNQCLGAVTCQGFVPRFFETATYEPQIQTHALLNSRIVFTDIVAESDWSDITKLSKKRQQMARGCRAFGALVLLAVLCTGTRRLLRSCLRCFEQQSDSWDCVLPSSRRDTQAAQQRAGGCLHLSH